MTCWQQLQSESDFCDVTLVCDDGNIKAHKFMISPYSPVLKIKIFVSILIIKPVRTFEVGRTCSPHPKSI